MGSLEDGLGDKRREDDMTVVAVTSANVGTKLATAADTKITGMTITQPTASADLLTPFTLIDSAAAPTGAYRTLYSAVHAAMAFIFGYKPGVSLSPGLTAPTWPQTIDSYPISFTNGVFVLSCPVGITVSVTTGP